MNKHLLAADIENLKRLWEICNQKPQNERTQMLLQSLGNIVPIKQSTETPENESGLSDRDVNLLLQRKVSAFLNELLFFLEPTTDSHFELAQEIMEYNFSEDICADYPKDKCRWYEIAWILLWILHQLHAKTAPNLKIS